MNVNESLEILLSIFLVLFFFWLIQHVVAKAFKVIIILVIVVSVFFAGYKFYTKHNVKKSKTPEYRYHVNELVGYDNFNKKLDSLKKETIKRIEKSYKKIKQGK